MIIKSIILLIILNNTSETNFMSNCKVDSDCLKKHNKNYRCKNSQCQHMDIFPLTSISKIGALSIIIVSAFANAGGIGGGAIIIPIYVFLFNFTIGDSIPLSKATILAGAIVNIFMIFNKRHPESINYFLIDYELISYIIPLVLSGTMVGVVLTKFLPSLIIFLILIIFLYRSTYKLFWKAYSLHKKEQDEAIIGKKVIKKQSSKSEKNTPIKENKEEKALSDGKNNISWDEDSWLIMNDNILKKNKKKSFCEIFKPFRISTLLIFCCYFLILTTSLLIGGKGFNSIINLKSCSIFSLIIFLICQIICYLISTLFFQNIKKNQKDILFDNLSINNFKSPKMLTNLFYNSYLAGILAGTLGIGGGLVINPVLLKQGFIPEVSAAISGVVVLFTSLSTTSQFLIAGAFNFYHAGFIIILSSIGSFIGNMVIDRLVKSYKKPSFIVWILFLLMLASAVVLPIVGGFKILDQDNVLSFGSPC